MAVCQASAQEPPGLSLSTGDRLEAPGWWPTKGDAPRSLYAGSAACAACHGGITALQDTTPMYHAAVRASESEILASHAPLKFQEQTLTDTLSRSSTGVAYTVTNGVENITAPAVWAFGAGFVGQTYLLRKGDAYIESRLSYYTSLGSLDITIGHSDHPPAGVDAALGHVMTGDVARRCFSCHTTLAVASKVFQPEKATPGVHCEACHGPGAGHVAAMHSQQYERDSATIMNPALLAPSDSVDFCGACHRTWADVVTESPAGAGIMTVRFQPYRLENSRCWGKNGDARITCIACHDPHQPLARESSAYDSQCLACHVAGQEPQPDEPAKTTCKVGSSKCTSCHMPKYELRQTHAIFTDHYIRVVRTTLSKAGAD
jgi:Cytochrome c554 and c-prime